ncbi:MAG: acyl carrier protein [Clostridia bacterium]|nr:acyl carrier protein [Clostridia bacterium]
MEVDEITAEDHFKSALGLSSFDLVCVMADIKTEFGIAVTAADFINNKTVGQMAAYLASAN